MTFPHSPELDPGADVGREALHFRHIDMCGFRREDGLFEVEGRVIDRKPYAFKAASSDRTVPAHEAIHDMGIRLVFDRQMVVRDVQTFTEAAPYDSCPDGGRMLQALKGACITSGWGKEVRKRLGRASSCAHLRELLMPLATTAIQSMSLLRQGQPAALDVDGRPRKIDSCYAYAADGDLVRRLWPEFHREPPSDE